MDRDRHLEDRIARDGRPTRARPQRMANPLRRAQPRWSTSPAAMSRTCPRRRAPGLSLRPALAATERDRSPGRLRGPDIVGTSSADDSDRPRASRLSADTQGQPSGKLLATTGSFGQGRDPQKSAVAVDATGRVFAVRTGPAQSGDRVRVYDQGGHLLATFGSSGSGDGQFGPGWILGIALDGQGDVYLTNARQHRLEKFASCRGWRRRRRRPDTCGATEAPA
jgi:hypothetical protein